MVSSARWYGLLLSKEDGHVMSGSLDFEVEGQRMKGRLKVAWKKQVEDERVKVDVRRGDVIY